MQQMLGLPLDLPGDLPPMKPEDHQYFGELLLEKDEEIKRF